MSQESRDFGNQMYLVSSLSTNISWSCILSIPSRNLSFNFLFYKLGTIAPVSNGGGENFNEIAFAFSKPSMNLRAFPHPFSWPQCPPQFRHVVEW